MCFPAFPAQDWVYFHNERELQINQWNKSNYFHEATSVDISPFTYMKCHNKVSSFVFLIFRTLALFKGFIVKTSFSLSLKIHFGVAKTIMSITFPEQDCFCIHHPIVATGQIHAD